MKRRADPSAAWYRQPVLWLGAAIFVASMAGCVWVIVAGVRHADEPVATTSRRVLDVPTHHEPEAESGDVR